MEQDAHNFAKTCHKCQIHSNLIHAPAQELQPVVSPWPFSQWAFDLIGAISPPSSDGHKFIIIATEYFTKWVDAVPLTFTTGKQISRFILNYIICRYGVPLSIISDHGTPFQNKDVDKLCEKYNIYHGYSSIYHPQGNGQAEASNKTIVKILQKTVNESGRDWHLQLNPALWAYRTSVRAPTGATPYSLVYGAEAILPIEIEIPSLRVSLQGIVDDETYRVSRLHELEMLDERRRAALTHLQVYQNRLKRSYNKKVRGRHFEIGDLVLRMNYKTQRHREKPKKFEPNWEGPYVVTAAYGSGVYQLATPEGEPLPVSTNSMHLQKYYT